MASVVIDKRFCGPADSGNGGYAAGLFAKTINGPAEVSLLAPPPLDTPISIINDDNGGLCAQFGDTIIAKMKPTQVDFDAPPCPDFESIKTAHTQFLSECDGEHLIPYCFVCGNRRAEGDGLRIFSGPVPESSLNADFWTPGADLADGQGFVREEFLWAALDCPSAFALRIWPAVSLLGQIRVNVISRPKVGERLVAAGWPKSRDGRKHFAASALYNEAGDLIAQADTLWIELRDGKLLAKLRQQRDAPQM